MYFTISLDAVSELLSKGDEGDDTNVLFLWVFSSANAVVQL
jgi:hypothetical protein